MKGIVALAAGLGITMGAYAMEEISTPRETTDYIVLGMGCFWGAEKRMGEIPGVNNSAQPCGSGQGDFQSCQGNAGNRVSQILGEP